MSSIFDLITDGEDGEAAFSATNLDRVLDEVIANRPVAGRPAGYDPSRDGGASPSPMPDGEVHGDEGGETGSPAPVPPEAPAASPPAEPVSATPPAQTPPSAPAGGSGDPLFEGLTDLERMELAQLRQALGDPERALGVRRALLGVEAPAPAVATTPPEPPPAPTLPEDIEPGSFEAQLWQSNQDLKAQLDELRQGQQAQSAQTEQERMNAAAQRATASFAGKYGSVLTQAEMQAVAQHAGLRKLPEAFYPATQDWDKAMTEALEYVVRSDDVLLGRVLGANPAPPAAPGAESVHTKRQLTALSSAASPSGDSPQRSPIEHRPDGKLTEKSRLALVQEMMNGGGMTGSPGEGI